MDNNNKFNQLVTFELKDEQEVEVMASLFAEFAYSLDPFTDVFELTEAFEDYITEHPGLNLRSIHVLAQLARACNDKTNSTKFSN